MNLMLLVSVIFGAGNTHDCALIKSIGSSFLSIHFIPDNCKMTFFFIFSYAVLFLDGSSFSVLVILLKFVTF